MKLKFLSIIIFCIPFLLTGCDKQSAYRDLLKNPDKLNAALTACASGQLASNSENCLQAQAARQAVLEFIEVQKIAVLKYPDIQAQMQEYQQLMSQTNIDAAAREKIQAELPEVNQFYFEVSEGYGKRIMQKEIELAALKERSDQQQIKYTEMIIQAMLALINVNSGGEA